MVISALTVTICRFSPPAKFLLCVKTAKERNHCVGVAGEARCWITEEPQGTTAPTAARRWSLLFCSKYKKERWDVRNTAICKEEKNSLQFQICKLNTPSKSQKANTGHYKNSPIFFNPSLNPVCTIFDEPFIKFLGDNKTTFPNQINIKKQRKQQKKRKTRQHFIYIEERENRLTRVMCSEQRIAVWGGTK